MTSQDSTPVAHAQRPKRRWLQYGLRSLLVLTLAAAVFFGWIAHEKRKYARQQAALERLSNRGAWYKSSKASPRWLGWFVGKDYVQVDELFLGDWGPEPNSYLKQIEFQPSELSTLPDVFTVRKLTIVTFPLKGDDSLLEPVCQLRSLESLRIHSAPISDDGLRKLAALPNLKALVIWGTKATAALLKDLSAFPSLETLVLDWGGTPSSIEVTGFPRLTSLSLGGSNYAGSFSVTVKGNLHIHDLPLLQRLEIYSVTDEEIRVASLPLLHNLMILGDARAIELADLPRLEALDLKLHNHFPEQTNVSIDNASRNLKTLKGVQFQLANGADCQLPCLEVLEVGEAELNGLGNNKFPNLRKVRIANLTLRDSEMAALLAHESLKSLQIAGISFDIKLLTRCPNLVELWLAKTQISDKCLEAVGQLPALRKLVLGTESEVQGHGLQYLSVAPALEELWIFNNTQLDDAIVPHLVALRRLKRLELHSTRISDQQPLKDGLPNLATFHQTSVYLPTNAEELAVMVFVSEARASPKTQKRAGGKRSVKIAAARRRAAKTSHRERPPGESRPDK